MRVDCGDSEIRGVVTEQQPQSCVALLVATIVLARCEAFRDGVGWNRCRRIVSSALPQSIVCERGESDHGDCSFAISHSFVFISTKIDIRMEAKMPRQTFSRAIEGVETGETELNLLACHLCMCTHVCPNTLVSCMHPCVYTLRVCFLSHSYRRGTSASVKVSGGCTHLLEVMSHRLMLLDQLFL